MTGAHHWYAELKQVFQKHGFVALQADEVVFYKFLGKEYAIVVAATDDFTIIGDSTQSTSLVKKHLADHFEIVDLGPINWLLGISLTRNHDARTIALGQQVYIEQIVTCFGLEDARPATTPMEPGIDLTPGLSAVSPNLLTPSGKAKYREMISCLMYASVMTQPDITFAVSSLSQHLKALTMSHMHAVMRVFHYLHGTKELKLIIGGKHSGVTGYSDADWASHLHRHSISGYAQYVGDGIVSWSAKKQPIVTLSSTEAEYVALTHGSKDVLWIQKLLLELHPFVDFRPLMDLYCDNQGAIHLSKDSTFRRHTKHIDVHFHFIRQTISMGASTVQLKT